GHARSRATALGRTSPFRGKGGKVGNGRNLAIRAVPAIVSFLNPQPALSLVGGNRSSCPIAAVPSGQHDAR
ncbi:MAG TPA: hypothetical protein VJ251_06990, partial [Stellaceae bacterium]|nr:hypothetical protein [Stellaceae bacterium]